MPWSPPSSLTGSRSGNVFDPPFDDMAARKLWAAAVAWIQKSEPSCPESMYQMDDVNVACPELAIAVCDIVGYVVDDD